VRCDLLSRVSTEDFANRARGETFKPGPGGQLVRLRTTSTVYDSGDDLAGGESDSASEYSDTDGTATSATKIVARAAYVDRKRHFFACQPKQAAAHAAKRAKATGAPPGGFATNRSIAEALGNLEEIYAARGDQWREFAYRKAKGIVLLHPRELKTREDVMAISTHGFGGKIKNKVIEWLETGEIGKLTYFEHDESTVAIRELTSVFGIGATTANQLYAAGCRTIADLRERTDLSHKAKLGLKYHEDMQLRIPREEITQIEQVVRQGVMKHVPTMKIEIAGSYRRMRPDSGDVDVLMSLSSRAPHVGVFPVVMAELKAVGFIVDDILDPSDVKADEAAVYMGFCRLRPDLPVRRIDIRLYPRNEWPFALLYFTGSDHFNRSMRLFADKKGYSLSDHGLCPVIRERRLKGGRWMREKVVSGATVFVESERAIFDFLGLEWVDPPDRNGPCPGTVGVNRTNSGTEVASEPSPQKSFSLSADAEDSSCDTP